MLSEILRIAKQIIRPFVPKFVVAQIKGRKNIKLIKQMNIKDSDSGRLFLLGTPSHSNLGDQAIAMAEIQFLMDKYKDVPLYDFTHEEVEHGMIYLSKIISPKDIIIIHGGGNMGTLWYEAELLRFNVIKTFLNNRIIIFPQSIFYQSAMGDSDELKLSQQVYAMHKDLHIIARETYSYKLMQAYYPSSNIYITPDIVLYLDVQEPQLMRNGILLCFRSDKEKAVSDNMVASIRKFAKLKTDDVLETDTVLHDLLVPIKKEERREYLEQKFNQFKQSELVITDRLHGMVFAAITATPCIVFGNNYHKIKGTHEWIKDVKSIKFVDSNTDIKPVIDALYGTSTKYDKADELRVRYDVICNLINAKV